MLLKEDMHYIRVNDPVYKYELLMNIPNHVDFCGLVLKKDIDTDYCSLFTDGTIIGKLFYRWDGPSGPTYDSEDTMHASSLWSWIQKSPQEAGAVIGQQLGLAKVQDMLNVGIAAAVAALSNVGATVVHDGTAATATLAALNSGSALFGDRAQMLLATVMHSKVFHDLVAKGLTNAERLFTFENVQIMQDHAGRPFIVTDSPSLITAGSPDTYHNLSLVAGGIAVEENNDFLMNIETSNGDENILRTYQAEWTYNLGLKGFTWDTTNGGKSPNDSALGTGTNWDKTATSIKDVCGVLTNTQ